MGAGFHSGLVEAERIKVGGTYLDERQFIKKEDFDTTYISGAAATASIVGTGATAVPVYSFTAGLNDQVAFRFVAPSSLKRNTKARLRVLWTKISGAAFAAGDVVWDAEYWAASVLTSGVEVAGRNYNISGAEARDGLVTATTSYTQAAALVSGVINETVLDIPAKAVAPNDLVRVQLSRSNYKDADTLDDEVGLIGVLIEYVDG